MLLKLFSYCVKVKINRQQLVKPEMNTLNVMLGTLNLVRTVHKYSVSEWGAHGSGKPVTAGGTITAAVFSRLWWLSRKVRTAGEQLWQSKY